MFNLQSLASGKHAKAKRVELSTAQRVWAFVSLAVVGADTLLIGSSHYWTNAMPRALLMAVAICWALAPLPLIPALCKLSGLFADRYGGRLAIALSGYLSLCTLHVLASVIVAREEPTGFQSVVGFALWLTYCLVGSVLIGSAALYGKARDFRRPAP